MALVPWNVGHEELALARRGFQAELMTRFVTSEASYEPGNDRQFADAGYQVNMAAAQPYHLPDHLLMAEQAYLPNTPLWRRASFSKDSDDVARGKPRTLDTLRAE